ncbi:MAG: type VII secretion target [Mycobacterium sp.]
MAPPDPQPTPPSTTVTFCADTAAIRACAQEYDTLSQTRNRLIEYINHYVELDFADSRLFGDVRAAVTKVHDKMADNGARINDLIAGSAEELRRAAEMYDRMDDNNEARLDATYSTKPKNL